MTPRGINEARNHGTYFRFNIKGWIEGLAFPSADSLDEGLSYLRKFEKDCTRHESNPCHLAITSVDRYLPGGSIGCEIVETVIPPNPHVQDSDCLIDLETSLCVVCHVSHGQACPCGGRGYHRSDCEDSKP